MDSYWWWFAGIKILQHGIQHFSADYGTFNLVNYYLFYWYLSLSLSLTLSHSLALSLTLSHSLSLSLSLSFCVCVCACVCVCVCVCWRARRLISKFISFTWMTFSLLHMSVSLKIAEFIMLILIRYCDAIVPEIDSRTHMSTKGRWN